MIKANELRIGNWVLDDGEPGMISSIGTGGISFFTINGFNCNRETGSVINTGIDKFKPIPLTSKILEKAGFELVPLRQSIYIKKRLKLWVGHTGCIAYLKHEDKDDSFWIGDCKYLHQLQNLYFALTGEELEVTL